MSTDVKIKAPFKLKKAGNISPGQLFNSFWLYFVLFFLLNFYNQKEVDT